MEFKREQYLKTLIDCMHNGLIKVITGMRRSGKSYLLFNLFTRYLRQSGVPGSHIVPIELDVWENRQYRNPGAILDYIESRIEDSANYYILLDEVQMLDGFEEALNSLLHVKNVDIYVTGSNSKFLSKDVITEFRGRGYEIHVYPLTFKEFMESYEGDIYRGWADYVVYGGLPLVASMKTEAQKVKYLTDLFVETYLKDIIERNRIEKTQELEDVVNILASSVGSLTNPSKILATFRSELHSQISLNTVRRYVEYLEDAFVISAAQRYDVKGRKYVGSPLKYYFEDVGLRNARLDFRQTEENHIMENVIYNELRSRGFAVDVGMVRKRERDAGGKQLARQLEIDFVANLGSRRYYVQSAFSLAGVEKTAQEKAPLNCLGDSFKKIIVVKDVVNVTRDANGITTMNVFDFLTKENSLEL